MKKYIKLLSILIFVSCQKDMSTVVNKSDLTFVATAAGYGDGYRMITSASGTILDNYSDCEKYPFPMEYKEVNGQYATQIIISPVAKEYVVYSYVDKYDNVLLEEILQVNTEREIDLIKADVFSALSIEDLRPMEFKRTEQVLQYKYVAFGNLVHLIDNTYAWTGRVGNKHLGIGRIAVQKFNSLDRSFLPFISVARTPTNPEVRGGSSFANGTIFSFNAIYYSTNGTFTKLTLSKSTDNGLSFVEQPLLYKVGTNGGIDETKYHLFNFYGTPTYVPEKNAWVVPWYENDLTTYRVNYLYSTDEFQTWSTHNIYEGTQQLTETAIAYVGNGTLISMSRQEGATRMNQSVCTNIDSHTWSIPQEVNLGSGVTRTLPSLLYTFEYGLIVLYADRGTYNIMISLNNDVNTIIANPLGYSTPKIVYTVGLQDIRKPLGYPSIIQVSQKRYMIAFGEEINPMATYLWIGDGSLKNFE